MQREETLRYMLWLVEDGIDRLSPYLDESHADARTYLEAVQGCATLRTQAAMLQWVLGDGLGLPDFLDPNDIFDLWTPLYESNHKQIIVKHLSGCADQTLKQIADATGLTKQRARTILDRLEERDVVTSIKRPSKLGSPCYHWSLVEPNV